MAMLAIAFRLLRCNPMANRRVADPVHRTRWWRPRPNAVPTFFAVLSLSGLVVVMTAGIAEAVGVSGGCTATINGKDPSQLDSDHPLVVHKGETVQVTGTAPSQFAGQAGQTSNTHIEVKLIDGVFGVTSSDHPGHGPQWGGTQNVDKYLKYGVGLYHVVGHADGSPGWKCDGDGYVQLKDGNPLGKPIGAGAAGLAVIGGAGALLSARAGAPDAGDSGTSAAALTGDGGSDDADERTADDMADVVDPDGSLEAIFGFGCLLLIAVLVGGAFLAKTVGVSGAAAMAAGTGEPKRRIWSHGHPIAGFIFGLLGGIGITLLMQQFAVWPLTIVTAIVFPIVVALVCAVRAYLGRPYKVVPRA